MIADVVTFDLVSFLDQIISSAKKVVELNSLMKINAWKLMIE